MVFLGLKIFCCEKILDQKTTLFTEYHITGNCEYMVIYYRDFMKSGLDSSLGVSHHNFLEIFKWWQLFLITLKIIDCSVWKATNIYIYNSLYSIYHIYNSDVDWVR